VKEIGKDVEGSRLGIM